MNLLLEIAESSSGDKFCPFLVFLQVAARRLFVHIVFVKLFRLEGFALSALLVLWKVSHSSVISNFAHSLILSELEGSSALLETVD